jgi:ketosteroid isomerase-like protein
MKKLTYIFLLLSPLFSTVYAQPALPMTPVDVHKQWMQAFNEKNIPWLCSLYEKGAIARRLDGSIAKGRAEICKDLTGLVNSAKRIEMTTDYSVEGDAFTILRSRYLFTLEAENKTEQKIFGSGIEVVQKQSDGKWLIVADHPQGGN